MGMDAVRGGGGVLGKIGKTVGQWSLLLAFFIVASCDNQETSTQVASQVSKDKSQEQPTSSATLRVKNNRIVFNDIEDITAKFKGLYGGSPVSILNERGGISVFGEGDDGFTSKVEVRGMPDEYLNDPRCPINNKNALELPDPVLSSVLNFNNELQVNNKIVRIEDEYTFSYTEGYFDEIAKFKASGVEISGQDRYEFSEHLMVSKLPPVLSENIAAGSVKKTKVFWPWDSRWIEKEESEDLNFEGVRLKCKARQWYIYVDLLLIYIKTSGVSTSVESYDGRRCFLWWCWDVWAPARHLTTEVFLDGIVVFNDPKIGPIKDRFTNVSASGINEAVYVFPDAGVHFSWSTEPIKLALELGHVNLSINSPIRWYIPSGGFNKLLIESLTSTHIVRKNGTVFAYPYGSQKLSHEAFRRVLRW
ncbi:hypothetical protein CHS0354_000735 [Potamilus streckersoni]|uniref:Uncharacterized protein n=1 Tax=Potamilus streckersoni TaxID=2493646 RepID=A0AAE0W8J8_9BIVA|nr:hypothetical protein CHS0354_000735 [Potamilus streckersoni]